MATASIHSPMDPTILEPIQSGKQQLLKGQENPSTVDCLGNTLEILGTKNHGYGY